MPAKTARPPLPRSNAARKAAIASQATLRQIFGHVRRIEAFYPGTFAALIQLPFQAGPSFGSSFVQVFGDVGDSGGFQQQQLLATALATGNMVGFRGISVPSDFPSLDGVTYEPLSTPVVDPFPLAEIQIAPLFVQSTTTVVNEVYSLLTVTLYNVPG